MLSPTILAGRGSYPTIQDCAYEEKLQFANSADKPFVSCGPAGYARLKPTQEDTVSCVVAPVAARRSMDAHGAFSSQLAPQGGEDAHARGEQSSTKPCDGEHRSPGSRTLLKAEVTLSRSTTRRERHKRTVG